MEMGNVSKRQQPDHKQTDIYDTDILQIYLDRPVNQIFKPFICKYRISAHSLNIEQGRYYKVDR